MFWPKIVQPLPYKPVEWKIGPAPSVPPVVREALKRAHGVMQTAYNDKSDDLAKPERQRVIARAMDLVRDALNALPPEA